MTYYQGRIARLTHLDPFTVETLMIEENHTLDHLTDDDFRAFIGSIEAVAANEGITAAAWIARERADMVAAGLMADDRADITEGDAA
ncbi:hypothetical protein [Albidovulum sp.]|uniref:hypothetical protein n=1 Tax=Albidovulum sp. TaxID=1872424 RepID=UPI0039B83BEC